MITQFIAPMANVAQTCDGYRKKIARVRDVIDRLRAHRLYRSGSCQIELIQNISAKGVVNMDGLARARVSLIEIAQQKERSIEPLDHMAQRLQIMKVILPKLAIPAAGSVVSSMPGYTHADHGESTNRRIGHPRNETS